jgi:hypothetical protein
MCSLAMKLIYKYFEIENISLAFVNLLRYDDSYLPTLSYVHFHELWRLSILWIKWIVNIIY